MVEFDDACLQKNKIAHVFGLENDIASWCLHISASLIHLFSGKQYSMIKGGNHV
jgi:hypothetical protein